MNRWHIGVESVELTVMKQVKQEAMLIDINIFLRAQHLLEVAIGQC